MKSFALSTLFVALLAMAGCSHTFEGIGKDLQEIGKSLEKAGEK